MSDITVKYEQQRCNFFFMFLKHLILANKIQRIDAIEGLLQNFCILVYKIT